MCINPIKRLSDGSENDGCQCSKIVIPKKQIQIEFIAVEKTYKYNCVECDDGISESDRVKKDSENYCEYCFNKKFDVCSECDDVHDREELYNHDSSLYCESCESDKFIICCGCEEWFDIDDSKCGDGESYCEDCFRENYIECEDCDSVVCIDECYSSEDGYSYCSDCYSERFFSCDGCSEEYARNDMFYSESDDCSYCESCYSENNEENFVEIEVDESDSYDILGSKRRIGIEVEVATTTIDYDKVANDSCFKRVGDGSLNCGSEFVSPILSRDKGLKEIEKFCTAIGKQKSDKSAGLHIHYDSRGLSWQQIKRVFWLYRVIESELFLMLPYTREINTYCKPLKQELFRIKNINSEDELKELWYNGDDSGDKYDCSRYHNLNLHSHFFRGTIEIRSHSTTTNYNKILNWLTINLNFIEYAITHSDMHIQQLQNKVESGKFREVLGELCDGLMVEYYDKRVEKFKSSRESEVVGIS